MRSILRELSDLRRDAGPAAARRRLALLRRARASLRERRAGAARPDADALRRLHDELLFLCAYPDEPRVLSAAENALRHVTSEIVAAATRAAALRNSGIAATVVEHGFSVDLLAWLAEHFGRAVAPAWDDGSLGAAFDELLPLLGTSSEADGTITHRLTTRQWVRRAMGRAGGAELAWIVDRLRRLPAAPVVLDHVVEALDLTVRWRLARRGPSRSFTRFPPRPTFYQREPLLRRVDVQAAIAERLPPPKRLTPSAAAALIDAARATLAVRGRETDPVTYANPREVALFRLERGVDVALFGMAPERRQPVESFFGFVAARNRVPVGYGGGWVFFERCEIGVNLFEEFRGGESAFVFSQVLRVYARHFRARQFIVDPYQFGADNQEAIQSGAFWFYHRLGFRPIEAAVRRLADAELSRIGRDPARRSPPRVLKRLAASKLFLDVGAARPAARFAPVAPDLVELGLALTGWIGRRFRGDRDAAQRWAVRRVAQALGVSTRDGWRANERVWFERLAPLVAMAPELSRWAPSERRALAAVLRLKGGPRERAYALTLQQHSRLQSGFATVLLGRRAREALPRRGDPPHG